MLHLHTVLFDGTLEGARAGMRIDNETRQDVDVFYEIACTGISENRLLPDRWELPGLTVRLDAQAPVPSVRRLDSRTVRVIYPSRISVPESLHMYFQLDPEHKEEQP